MRNKNYERTLMKEKKALFLHHTGFSLNIESDSWVFVATGAELRGHAKS